MPDTGRTVEPHIAQASLADFGAQVASVSYASIDAAAQTAACQRLRDALVAVAIGCHTPEGRLLDRYAGRWHGNGATCRLLTGAARSTEVDDIDLPACTTVGSVVVPVAVTMAAARPNVGEGALLSAVVGGYEAMTRLGRAIGGATLLYRGVSRRERRHEAVAHVAAGARERGRVSTARVAACRGDRADRRRGATRVSRDDRSTRVAQQSRRVDVGRAVPARAGRVRSRDTGRRRARNA